MANSSKILPILMDAKLLPFKFRGSLLGGLLGDCCGAPYEDDQLNDGDRLQLKRYFDKLEGPYFKSPIKSYTDDTALTKCVVKSLIEKKDIVPKDLAGEFVKEYFKEPNRRYGGAIAVVFSKLRQNKLADPLSPAQEQFEGRGSYGNGAAMRIAPVGLFCHDKPSKVLVDMAKRSAIVTHTHRLAINGAILQALAVQYCVNSSVESFKTEEILDYLMEQMKVLENEVDELGLETGKDYQNKLTDVKKLLKKDDPSIDELMNKLGNTVTAIQSVPTALYCFLRAQRGIIKTIDSTNPLRRTLEYAITLGGDTDTIASMAGSICGALYGDNVISENILAHCEGNVEIKELADNLLTASGSS